MRYLGSHLSANGYWRQQVMERALVEGRFVPFDGRAALAFTVAGIVLGFATLLAIVV
jgi:hypothetical protein